MINNLFLNFFNNDPEVESKILKIIAEQMGVAEDELSHETKFMDLGADSLDMVELTMEVEDNFDLMIQDEEVEKIKTVGEAIDFVFLQINLKG